MTGKKNKRGRSGQGKTKKTKKKKVGKGGKSRMKGKDKGKGKKRANGSKKKSGKRKKKQGKRKGNKRRRINAKKSKRRRRNGGHDEDVYYDYASGSGDEYEPGSGDDYEPSGDELYTNFGSRDDSSEESRSGKHGEDDKECPEKKKVLEVNRECLEPESDVRLIGKKGLILGWGKNDDDEKSNDLNEVELTVISNSACRKAFK